MNGVERNLREQYVIIGIESVKPVFWVWAEPRFFWLGMPFCFGMAFFLVLSEPYSGTFFGFRGQNRSFSFSLGNTVPAPVIWGMQ